MTAPLSRPDPTVPGPEAQAAHPFSALTPQAVLDMLDSVGLRGDGRLLQLNSYENRVFQVHLEEGPPVVVKFYRPGRWTPPQLAEEHAFALALAAAEVPVVAPLPLAAGLGPGHTLGQAQVDGHAFHLAAYPCRSGHGPELDRADTLRWLGRFIGRLHAVGAQMPFQHRRTLDPQTFGHAAVERIQALALLPDTESAAWLATAAQALAAVDAAFAATPAAALRLHGDCHPGNILWRDEGDAGGPQIVDLDDAATGPAVQDLWMLLSGDATSMRTQMAWVLAGYRQFMPFDLRELALIEPLRTLRMLHHSAWIAERWTDPAFPAAFPWFGTAAYWRTQTGQLHEQLEAMAQPPLALGFDLDWLD